MKSFRNMFSSFRRMFDDLEKDFEQMDSEFEQLDRESAAVETPQPGETVTSRREEVRPDGTRVVTTITKSARATITKDRR